MNFDDEMMELAVNKGEEMYVYTRNQNPDLSDRQIAVYFMSLTILSLEKFFTKKNMVLEFGEYLAELLGKIESIQKTYSPENEKINSL